jgi:hypothetical protein
MLKLKLRLIWLWLTDKKYRKVYAEQRKAKKYIYK